MEARGLRTVATLVAALTLGGAALAGCGGDDGSGPTTSRVERTTSTAPTTGGSSTTGEPATTTSGAPTSLPPTTVPVTPTTQPTPGGPAVELRRGPASSRTVALTFDAGSDRGFAADILDTLAHEHIAAAFGMTGDWAAANPDLVRRMVAEGHLLLNHTEDHRSFTGSSTSTAPLSAAQRAAELRGAEDAVAAAGGGGLRPWFRPPYGDTDAGVLRDLGANGYGWSVLWTVDSLGWKGLSAQAIADRCLDGAVPGAIYLMHVGSASQDAAALATLIPQLRDAGYGFVRVDRFVPG